MKQRTEIKFNDPPVILSSDMFYATDVNILFHGKLGACSVYLELVDSACCGASEEMFI